MTERNEEFERELQNVRWNFTHMAKILREGASHWAYPTPPAGAQFRHEFERMRWMDWNRKVEITLTPHAWHSSLQQRYPLHKAIMKCMGLARPADWHQLLLEWPHVSDTDPTRLAYTRDERAGVDNRQTVTTIGKYITRHFPALASHHVRDITALFAADQCKMVHTIAEMIYHLGRGPQSCMKWHEMDIETHPYACYDPRLGWSMAIREEGGETVARALVYKRAEGDAWFVRSYTKNDNFSHSDTILEAWLNAQGIPKCGDWEGAKLAKVVGGRNSWGTPILVYPYIDGGVQRVTVRDDYMLIDDNGDKLCNNTDGTADDEDLRECEDCGSMENSDDGYWVNADEEGFVCSSCHSDYYYAYGRRGRQYYVHQDNVVHVGDNQYDEEYLDDNSIVRLHDGDYCHLDDAVLIESQDEYYRCEDENVVYTCDGEHELMDDCVQLANGEYCLTENAWECMHSNNWYHDDEDFVLTADGEKIHPDYADQCDMPEDYEAPEAKPVETEQRVIPEAAVERAPFDVKSSTESGSTLSVKTSQTNASPSLRDVVVYDVDGLRITKCAYQNLDLIRYQATKRVFDRELCVAHNALSINLTEVEARIVANLCEQIANTEAQLRQQFFTIDVARRYRDHLAASMGNNRFYQQSMTDMVLYGQSYTCLTWDEAAGVVHAAPVNLIGESE